MVTAENQAAQRGLQAHLPTSFNDLAGLLLHQPDHTVALLPDFEDNRLAAHALIGSIHGVVLSSKKFKPRVLTLQATELVPLETALKAVYKLVPKVGQSDSLSTGVMWNAAWLHLLSNMRFIEVACVRSRMGCR